MKVCGFGIIRNAVKYDYPVVESILSVLPIVDKYILLLGDSEDDTLDLVSNISNKVEIHHSVWDDALRKGGRVLAVETDKAFNLVDDTYDWALYLQADEIIHEKDHKAIVDAMKNNVGHPKVDGLLFNYKHFYGSYDYLANSSKWYRKEIRIIKNNKDIYSYRDAQGFKKRPKSLLGVKHVNADIYHYGWVKPPEKMAKKEHDFQRLWHNDEWIAQNYNAATNFDYSEIDSMSKFQGTHPITMKERISSQNWSFDFDLSKQNLSFKEKIKKVIELKTGWLPGEYKNYKLI